MTDNQTNEIINKIFLNIFETENKFSLEELENKFAFDIKLPIQVRDEFTNQLTWTNCENNRKFITNENMQNKDIKEGWMLPKQEIHSLEDIISIWDTINLTTTERNYDSINVSKSDTIYACENVYRSTDCRLCKNIVYCDGCGNSDFLLASQRTGSSSFCIRTDDSKDCSNSYNIICSNKISNSMFIQDCFNLYECIFCSHISNKRFCISNMQFSEEEYYLIKKEIINWILNS